MNCSTCKHSGRCDCEPGDDCYEPHQTIRFDDDMTLMHAYSILQRLNPGVRVRKSIKISGKFETLETVRAMRAHREFEAQS